MYNYHEGTCMKIGNGLKIATSNKSLWLKTMLAKSVVVCIFIAVIYAIASIIIEPILKSEELKELISAFRTIISDFVLFKDSAVEAHAELLKESTANLLIFINSMLSNIIWVGIAILILFQLMVFTFSMFDYVIGINVNEHMSSMLHSGFFGTLFENFKQASKYALYRTVTMFIYDIVVFSIIVLLFYALTGVLGMFTLTFIVAIIFISIALRLTFTGLILPIMISENKGPIEAMKESFKLYKIPGGFNRFFSYLIVSIVVYVVVLISGVVTFNVAYVLTIPLSGIVFKSLRFVDYYTIKCKKYYITFDEIVIPKELRQNDEQLLNKVDI